MPPGAQVKSTAPWIQFNQVMPFQIADQELVKQGVREAIDVWGPHGVDGEFCFKGMGSLVFLDAAYTPRQRMPVSS